MQNRTAMARIYLIHREISERRYPTVPLLMEHMECSESTVRRDIELMRDRLGAPLSFDRRRRGYYYAADYELPAIALTKEELEAIWVAHQWVRQTKGTPYESAMQRAWEKLSVLFGLDRRLLEAWSVVSVAAEPLRGAPEVLGRNYALLESAAQRYQVVRIKYYSPARDEETVREIEPIGLHFTNKACYCVAFCRLRREHRFFAVDRVREVTLIGELFEPHLDFRMQDYLSASLGVMSGAAVSLEILFTPEQARYLDEHPRHISQMRMREDSEGVVYCFELADNLETLRWVLSFGASATVLGPARFATRVQQELQSALGKY